MISYFAAKSINSRIIQQILKYKKKQIIYFNQNKLLSAVILKDVYIENSQTNITKWRH